MMPTRTRTGAQIREMIGNIKYCSGCGQTLSVTEFTLHGRDGYQSKCKTCVRAYQTSTEIRKRTREQQQNWRHRTGRQRPMDQAKDSAGYLGIYVAENALSKYFDNVKIMPANHTGWDYICGKGFKIDVKSGCRIKQEGISDKWSFHIEKNVVADYFLCLAFDNRGTLNPEHIWLIPAKVVNKRVTLSISESRVSKWTQYERPIDKVIVCCKSLRGRAP